ncbi:MAG: STT3 domain-containing protein [Verrucomicrobiales bacterium]|nr:STT3 domain-containing protein [Verrucomicrobiales bacterium]
MPTQTKERSLWIWSLLILALWGIIRVLPGFPVVFPETGDVYLLGNDPWFHLHHTRAALENFPHILRWDTGALYPDGTYADAAGLFNLTLAAFAGTLEACNLVTDAAPAVLAWSPVVIGGLSVFFLYLLVREISSPGVALLAITLRLLFPGEELQRTALGFGDQHAAEIALTTWLLWIHVRYCKVRQSTGSGKERWLWMILLPVSLVAFLFTWFGALLSISTLYLGFWIVVLLSSGRAESPAPLVRSFVLPYGIAFLLYAIATAAFPDLIMKEKAHSAILLVLFAQPALCQLYGVLSPRLMERWGRLKSTALLAALGLLLGIVALVVFTDAQKLVSLLGNEGRSLISEQSSADFRTLFSFYGLMIPWIAWGAYVAFRRSREMGALLFSVFLALWVVLWQVTADFGYLVCALLPVWMALGISSVFSKAAEQSKEKPRWPKGLAIGSAGATIVLFFQPPLVQPPLLFKNDFQIMLVATRPWHDAAEWIEKNTPAPSIDPTFPAKEWKRKKGFTYPDDVYGILSHWQYGNFLTASAKRFPVAARYPSGRFIDWFLETSEEDSIRNLSQYGKVRYVVMDASSTSESFPGEVLIRGHSLETFQIADSSVQLGAETIPLLSYGKEFRNATGAQLYLGNGPGFSHYRLVWESETESFLRYRALVDIEAVELRSTLIDSAEMYETIHPLTRLGAGWIEGREFLCYSGDIQPAVKIFEVVPGAEIQIRSGASVTGTVQLKLKSKASGRVMIYSQAVRADVEGRLRFTVPYPTGEDQSGSQFQPVGTYRIELSDGSSDTFAVSSKAVDEGLVVIPGES